jgi:hypothetical protein
MPLVTTGEISIGGTATNRSINVELGRAAGATSSLGETALRTLAGVSSGAISMNNFYGKANFTVSYVGFGFDNGSYLADLYDAGSGETGSISLRWNADGTMSILEFPINYTNFGVTWGAPTTAGIGSNYWIRFTRTATNSFGSPTAATQSTASTGWVILSNTPSISIDRTPGQHDFSATYTIEISSDSGGSTILSTRTGITIALNDDAL